MEKIKFYLPLTIYYLPLALAEHSAEDEKEHEDEENPYGDEDEAERRIVGGLVQYVA